MDVASRALIATLSILVLEGCQASRDERFVRLRVPAFALTHVRVIDGTGGPGIDDQTLVVRDRRIERIGRTGSFTVSIPDLDTHNVQGRTVLPGLVGMHDHLFYEVGPSSNHTGVTAQDAFTKLYLAAGVTTIRTAGTPDLPGDLRIKRLIEAGDEPGPRVHVTGPYLGTAGPTPDPEAVARQVERAADAGATSFKAYTTLRTTELSAAVNAAHRRGLSVTGHLCAIGFREAAALGIDNLEHGLISDTEFYSAKRRDECPSEGDALGELVEMELTDARIQGLIADLVRRGVAITSTLAIYETFTGREAVLDPHVPTILSSRLQDLYELARAEWSDPHASRARGWARALRTEMQFERMFVGAGGRLLAGVDPTGWGGVIAGSGDQREIELLVGAGFRPEAAIQIATANGAAFLRDGEIGTLEAGKRADFVIVRGNPSERISDIRNVEMVVKDGIGYDPVALTNAAQGQIGLLDFSRILRWPWNVVIFVLMLLLIARRLWRRSRQQRPV